MSVFNFHTSPAKVLGSGISFKPQHLSDLVHYRDGDLWLEVHTENYCGIGGPRKRALAQVADRFPVSLHGVGASLGGADDVSTAHLQAVAKLVSEVQPALISEHLAWSAANNRYFADLLPVRRSHQALKLLSDNIMRYQDAVKQPILIENPTHYVPLLHELSEPEFLCELAHSSGCGLLLDMTNLFLSEQNCGISAQKYLQMIPAHLVGEIHIAGYSFDTTGMGIDSHDGSITAPVVELLQQAISLFGRRPVLLEWDAKIPDLTTLLLEREQVRELL